VPSVGRKKGKVVGEIGCFRPNSRGKWEQTGGETVLRQTDEKRGGAVVLGKNRQWKKPYASTLKIFSHRHL